MDKDELKRLFINCNTIGYDQAGDSVNYKFIEKNGILYIYFQGSNQIADWVRNFLFKKKPYKDMETPYKVHRGFLAAWKEVEDIIINKITQKENNDYKYKRIIIVGYSHGGALAGFCHECCWFHRPDLRENNLYGFGFEAPRFYGGFKVKKELEERWKNFTVIRNNNDLVTHCPPTLFRFCHVGNIFKIHGNTSLVNNKLPHCIKSHYPQTVIDGIEKIS